MFLIPPIAVLSVLLLPACDTRPNPLSSKEKRRRTPPPPPCGVENEDCAPSLLNGNGGGRISKQASPAFKPPDLLSLNRRNIGGTDNPAAEDSSPYLLSLNKLNAANKALYKLENADRAPEGSLRALRDTSCSASPDRAACGGGENPAPETDNDPANNDSPDVSPGEAASDPKSEAWAVMQNQTDKVNVLFVIDDSYSMNDHIDSVISQFDDFLRDLGNMDVQIAVTTTFVEGEKARKGRFITFDNGKKWLSNPKKNPEILEKNIRLFKEALKGGAFKCARMKSIKEAQTHCPGGAMEQGIAAMNMSLAYPEHAGFFRPHSLLLAIIVSDENEKSSGKHLALINEPARFFANITHSLPYTAAAVHSIVYRTGDDKTTCPKGHSHGSVYESASHPSDEIMARNGNILKGKIISICAEDYSRMLGPVTQYTVKNRVMPLPCFVEKGALEVEVNGAKISDFHLEGRKLHIPEGFPWTANVRLKYRCRKGVTPPSAAGGAEQAF